MKKIFLALMLIAFIVLSTSNYYLWKDQVQQWQVLQTQIKMLERLLKWQGNNTPYIKHKRSL